MQTSRTFAALITVAILVLALAVPVSARTPVGIASGAVTWDGESGDSPGRTSVFLVRDGAPGENSSAGDRGSYSFARKGTGTLVLDVRCVRVESDWAEFAGVATAVTGAYVQDQWWLVSVYDSGKNGPGVDEIGMKGKANETKACKAALNDIQFGRKGIITDGNIKVRTKR